MSYFRSFSQVNSVFLFVEERIPRTLREANLKFTYSFLKRTQELIYSRAYKYLAPQTVNIITEDPRGFYTHTQA